MLFLPATVQPVPNRNGKELYINRRLPEDIRFTKESPGHPRLFIVYRYSRPCTGGGPALPERFGDICRSASPRG